VVTAHGGAGVGNAVGGRALAYLGRARARAGRHTAGDRELCEGAAEFGALDNRRWQGHCLEMRADIAARQGNTAGAIELLRQALTFHTASATDTARVEQQIRDLGGSAP
jgi:predicted negative regulator of RcsB-dependent stress response